MIGRHFTIAASIVATVAGLVVSPTLAIGGASSTCSVLVRSAEDTSAVGARAGDTVCFAADLPETRLHVTKGGTAGHPVTYAGNGHHVDGITIEADHVVVDGFVMTKPEAPGIELTGNHVTVRHNTVTEPHGDDGDGLRFFGDDLAILDNTISGTSNQNGHADCMQTFASDTPSSRGVRIEGNRCEQIDNMCLMAEGPNDGEGDGKGTTADFVVKDNYCETLEASQTLMFEDVQNTTITGNTFAAAPDHAIGLAIGSTGAHVESNTVSPGIGYEVGIDESSRTGYEGPRTRRPPLNASWRTDDPRKPRRPGWTTRRFAESDTWHSPGWGAN